MTDPVQPSLVNENKLPAGMPGKVARYFQICCYFCQGTEIHVATHLNKLLEDIQARKKDRWKLNGDYGWVHCKCNKTLPNTIKL